MMGFLEKAAQVSANKSLYPLSLVSHITMFMSKLNDPGKHYGDDWLTIWRGKFVIYDTASLPLIITMAHERLILTIHMLRHVEIDEIAKVMKHVDSGVEFDEKRGFGDSQLAPFFRLWRLKVQRGKGLEFGEPRLKRRLVIRLRREQIRVQIARSTSMWGKRIGIEQWAMSISTWVQLSPLRDERRKNKEQIMSNGIGFNIPHWEMNTEQWISNAIGFKIHSLSLPSEIPTVQRCHSCNFY